MLDDQCMQVLEVDFLVAASEYSRQHPGHAMIRRLGIHQCMRSGFATLSDLPPMFDHGAVLHPCFVIVEKVIDSQIELPHAVSRVHVRRES